MPTYEFDCPNCKAEYDIEMKMSEYTDLGHNCKSCSTGLKRAFRTPSGFKIPGHSTYNGITTISNSVASTRRKEDPAVPIRIQNDNGSTTIIGKKSDI